jgi:mono/diheme cytochrome c family protein
MKIHTRTQALLAIAAVAFYAASATFAQAPAPNAVGDADGAFIVSGKFSEPTGEKMYQRVCATCHMPDAKGAQGAGFYPALAGNPKLVAGGYPVSVVVHGLNGMPPIGGMMTDQQVADVVNYVRTHFGNKYKDAVTAADVKSMR